MTILLDTCTFLWALTDPVKLSVAARTIVKDTSIRTHLSSISVWEIAQKYGMKKLTLPAAPAVMIPEACRTVGFESLSFTQADALVAEKLPLHHRDPFDRMLIAQAITGGHTIVTPDPLFEPYPVRVLW